MDTTTAIATQRSPELIAAEINSIKNQTITMVLVNSIEIGRRLAEARSLIPHGEWGKWLEESVDYSRSTANNLIRIFEEYGANQLSLFGSEAKSQALGSLSYTQAVALLGLPAEEREHFVDEHDLESMSTRELQMTIKELQQTIKERNEARAEVEAKSNAIASLEIKRDHLEKDLAKAREDSEAATKAAKIAFDDLGKEKEKAQKQIKKMQAALEAAQASGDGDEAKQLTVQIKSMDQTITDLAKEKEELERQLREQPIEAAVVEKVPAEIEDELAKLRTQKFRLHFDGLVKGFDALLGALGEIPEEDQAKYNEAIRKLMLKMSERLG